MFDIKPYTPDHKDEWNHFVAISRQGTFLLDRNYMDYHSDRFTDHSLMVYDAHGDLFAMLPASISGDTLSSHGGLTYGGLLTGPGATAEEVLALFPELNDRLRGDGVRHVVYKAIPWIYHRIPAEEDLYAIFRTCNARLQAREISSSIFQTCHPKWHHGHIYGAKKSRREGVLVEESTDFAPFWSMLDANLTARHDVHPVHSLAELQLLKHRFPDLIRLYLAWHGDELLAGTLLFLTPRVLHAQYIASTAEGRRMRAVDALFDRILNYDFAQYPIFDFGKSTENEGQYLNESLIFQKEGFGARGVCYDTYAWDL